MVVVTCRLTHAGGHSEENTLVAPPDTKGNKNPAQAVQSTSTLLQRYTLLAILGIGTDGADQADQGPPDTEECRDAPATLARRTKALAAIKKEGRTVAAAEAFLGATMATWTDGQMNRLRIWLIPPPAGETKRPAGFATRAEIEAALVRGEITPEFAQEEAQRIEFEAYENGETE